MQVEIIPYTTTAAGAATVYSRGEITGRVYVVRYVPGTSEEADGTVTITGNTSGIEIFTIASFDNTNAATWYPRQRGVHLEDGSAVTQTDEDIMPPLLHEKIKIVLTNFDDNTVAGTGTFYIGYTD